MIHNAVTATAQNRLPSAFKGSQARRIQPSGQVAGLVPHWNGTTWTGRFVFNCRAWFAMGAFQRAQQIAQLRRYLPAAVSDASMIRALDGLCARMGAGAVVISVTARGNTPFISTYGASVMPSGSVRPAGQFFDTTQTGLGGDTSRTPLYNNDGSIGGYSDANGVITTAGGQPGTVDSQGNVVALGGGTSTSSSSPAVSASTQQVFNSVGQALGVAGSTISSVINSGNQLEIARLQNATQQYIANLQSSIATSTNAANTQLAQQRLAQAEQMQQALLQAQQGNMPLYIVGGVAALGILGFFGYMALSKRHNPVVRRHGRRKYVSAKHYRQGRR